MANSCAAVGQVRTSRRSVSPSWTIALASLWIFASALGVEAASLHVGWTGPTTNMDGTPLSDLAGYLVYLGAVTAPPCPGTAYAAVPSTTSAPAVGETAAYEIPGLTAGVTYVTWITAVDISGNESGCAGPASGIAHADLSVTPSTAVDFGSTPVGTAVNRTFTVTNATGATLSGTASVGAPFSVVSGSAFSLGPGANQAVVVRAPSTAPGTFASTVTFTANGDTVSRAVTATVVSPTGGSGGEIVVDNAPPGVQDVAGGRTFTGAWCLSNATNSFGPNALRSCGNGGDTYRWTPTIPATGAYDVYVWIPRFNGKSTNVPIVVSSATGTTLRTFNERKAPGGWVLHGRYTFNAGTAGYVQTGDDPGGVALADAVRFVPVK